jgi:hypothetical protein
MHTHVCGAGRKLHGQAVMPDSSSTRNADVALRTSALELNESVATVTSQTACARPTASPACAAAKAGAKIGSVLGSKAAGNVIKGVGIATKIGLAARKSSTATATVCGSSCAGQVPSPAQPSGGPPSSGAPPAGRTSVNGCDNEGCLCSAVGAGVHPNILDPTCATFFHCPGPKRPCGPGTLFNPETSVCDWPYNVQCMAVRM